MKTAFLLALIFLVSCSKSKSPDPSGSTAAEVVVQSATVVSGVLNVNLNFSNSSYVSQCQLVIYKTDINSVNYKYTIELKDGNQTVDCSHYTDSSPLVYQIKFSMKSGEVYFTPVAYQNYN
jgi:hypothetical protein